VRSHTPPNSADRNLQQGKEVEERHDVSHEPISPDATRLKVSRYQGDKNDHFTFLILKNTLVSVESHEEETSRKICELIAETHTNMRRHAHQYIHTVNRYTQWSRNVVLLFLE